MSVGIGLSVLDWIEVVFFSMSETKVLNLNYKLNEEGSTVYNNQVSSMAILCSFNLINIPFFPQPNSCVHLLSLFTLLLILDGDLWSKL